MKQKAALLAVALRSSDPVKPRALVEGDTERNHHAVTSVPIANDRTREEREHPPQRDI